LSSSEHVICWHTEPQNNTSQNVTQLQEIIIGNPKAPNTIIVYISFTCSHCRDFCKETLPELKKKYANTGKASIYIRFFLDDLGSLDATLLVRCLGSHQDEILNLAAKIFEEQDEWKKSSDPRAFLIKNIEKSNYRIGDIKRCLTNEPLKKNLEDAHTIVAKEIHLIPAFVINGKVHQGKIDVEKIDQMLFSKRKAINIKNNTLNRL
jgi:protein-disulfide isomerase